MKLWFADEQTKAMLFQLDEAFIPAIGDEFVFTDRLPSEVDLRDYPDGVKRFKKTFAEQFSGHKFTVTSIKRTVNLSVSKGNGLLIDVYGKLTPIILEKL